MLVAYMKLKNLNSDQLDKTVWRYMPFSKFISLMTYQALWFAKLNTLQDEYEGMIPPTTKKLMDNENQKYKAQFNTPDFHRQIDNWTLENENSGRELLVANCWFLDETESEQMWAKYGGSNEAVAIKSTIRRLVENVLVPHDDHVSHIGMVSYIDHAKHEMSTYEANQASERAFLKDKQRFSHEQEVRIVTMNLKTTTCASMEGKPYTPEEVAGKNMNNFKNPGLYVGVVLDQLFTEIVVCPGAEDWFANLVKRIIELKGLNVNVSASRLNRFNEGRT